MGNVIKFESAQLLVTENTILAYIDFSYLFHNTALVRNYIQTLFFILYAYMGVLFQYGRKPTSKDINQSINLIFQR